MTANPATTILTNTVVRTLLQTRTLLPELVSARPQLEFGFGKDVYV